MNMALSIIALVIALAALAFAIFNAVRIYSLMSEAERVNWQLKSVEAAVAALKKEDKEIPVSGLECASYDPETTTTTIDGNVVIKGFVSAGGIIEKK